MRHTRIIFTTAILTLLTFGAIVYSSCQKDRCKNLVCQHGGSCVNGFCACATGYTGDFCEIPNVTGIVFKNNTFTPVNITTNSGTKTVAAGKTLAYYGNYGDSLKASASTQGNYGLLVKWGNLTRKFPIRDTMQVDINLPSTYFYVFVRNNATEPLRNVYVNYNIPSHPEYQTLDILPIPVHVTYGIGYYKLYYNSNVRIEADTTLHHYWQFDNLGLDTGASHVNQNFTAEAI